MAKSRINLDGHTVVIETVAQPQGGSAGKMVHNGYAACPIKTCSRSQTDYFRVWHKASVNEAIKEVTAVLRAHYNNTHKK